MKLKFHPFWIVVALATLVYGCGLCVFGRHLDFPSDMVSFYSPMGVNLAEGRGYMMNGAFTNRYPPLFPLFIAGIYKITGQAGLSNPVYPWLIALMQAFSCGLLFLIAKTLTANTKLATAAALLFLFYPLFAVMAVTRYAWSAMPFFIFIFFAAAWTFCLAFRQGRLRYGLISGFLTGLSCLVWPSVIYLWAVWLPFLGLRGAGTAFRKGVLALVFMLGFLLPVSAWGVFVWRHTGAFEISGGGMLSVRDGLWHEDSPLYGRFEIVRAARAEKKAHGLQSPAAILHLYENSFRARPLETLHFMVFKLFRVWYGTDSEKYEIPILLLQLPYFALALWGFFALKNNDTRLFLAATAGYFWFIAFLVLSIVRYMMPVMGLLMILAAVPFCRRGERE